MTAAPAGLLLHDKPAGVTSHDVVATARRRYRGLPARVRVGHAGTLDPFATGLLLVLVGRATRAQRFLMALPKTYRAVARLGFTSDTGDRDGTLIETGRVPDRIELPTGPMRQRPPAYSAVRVGGERLYEKARRGEPEEGAPREVTVHRSQVLWREGDRVGLEVECSAGTYVRQLVSALGDAYCEQLERTRIGPFRLEDADPERLVSLSDALAFLPELALERPDVEAITHGRPLAAAGARIPAAGPMRLTHAGRVVAVAEEREGVLRSLVVFAE